MWVESFSGSSASGPPGMGTSSSYVSIRTAAAHRVRALLLLPGRVHPTSRGAAPRRPHQEQPEVGCAVGEVLRIRRYNWTPRGRSSAGRATGWQPVGQGFESPRLHEESRDAGLFLF